jgi:RNA polymerase sigma factor (sigma-70 family)
VTRTAPIPARPRATPPTHAEARALVARVQAGARVHACLADRPPPDDAGALLVAARDGRSAAGELIARNVGMLRRLVRHRRRLGHTGILDDEDLYQEAAIGFLKGILSYDAGHGAEVVTYCCRCAELEVLRAIQLTGRLIRVPVYLEVLLARHRRLEFRLGRTLDASESARLMGLQPGTAGFFREALVLAGDARRPFGTAGEPLEVLPDSRDDPDRAGSEAAERSEALREALARLPGREAAVLAASFGLDGRPPRGMADIGREAGHTRSRIQQVRDHAVQCLRSELETIL